MDNFRKGSDFDAVVFAKKRQLKSFVLNADIEDAGLCDLAPEVLKGDIEFRKHYATQYGFHPYRQ